MSPSSSSSESDPLAAVGGLEGLRAILADFYARVLADSMIGFMFADADPQRLVDKETELVARMLGASEVRYTGMPMRKSHQRHRIFGGQFARRQQLLRETLADHAVPPALAEAWLAHNERLRPQITFDPSSDCGRGMRDPLAESATGERMLRVTFPEDDDDEVRR